MKIYMLHENTKSYSLILFFAGFGAHYSHYLHLRSEHNVALVFDYRSFDDCLESLQKLILGYKKIYLIAYSMGVSVASKLFAKGVFYKTIAICGTNAGISKQFGIAPMIFRHTIKHFCLDDFKYVLFGDNVACKEVMSFFFAQEETLKEELQSLYVFCSHEPNLSFIWDKAYIAQHDSLFLPKICVEFFHNKSNIVFLDSLHYPFFNFKNWEEICDIG